MLFSSITFLYYFLPCVMIIYFLTPNRSKNLVLLLASLLFYAWGEPKFLAVMLLCVVQGYVVGILLKKYQGQKQAKYILLASICVSLGVLGYCKYADFFISNVNAVVGSSIPLRKIALPIGISFYIFQIISYVVDVYWQRIEPQKNFIHFGTYITMFSQLIAGPIVRYRDIESQLIRRSHSVEQVASGITRFAIGLSKKVLLANNMAELVAIYKDSDAKSVQFVWIYAIANLFYVYFDFSGYSDMAIGLGKILGFQFPENFNYPYISRSITEFWRRWHMTLGTWFRDYLYIPLGGNRVSRAKWFCNILVVWMATGLWHGAAWNFVMWGLMFAFLLIIEKTGLLRVLSKIRILEHIYVLFFVMISFILFDYESVLEGIKTIGGLFGAGKLPFITTQSMYYLKSYAWIFVICAIGATPIPVRTVRYIRKNQKVDLLVGWLEPFILLVLFVIVTAFLVDGSYNPFLYFRF